MSEHKTNPRALHFAPAPGQAAAPRLRDAVNRVLEIGDEVLVLTPSTRMRVGAITPVLHPGAPPNSMMLVLVAQLQVLGARDLAIEDVYFLRHASEVGDAARFAEAVGQVVPEGEQPPPVEPSTIKLTD